MELTYRRTVQVQEYESITLEAKVEYNKGDNARACVSKLEKFIDEEIIKHRDELRRAIWAEECADEKYLKENTQE